MTVALYACRDGYCDLPCSHNTRVTEDDRRDGRQPCKSPTALTRAGVPGMKEPHRLVRADGKRPDGLTLLPWNSGRSATWDVTVVDTLGNAYLQQSAITSASAAETAAVRTRNLSKAHETRESL